MTIADLDDLVDALYSAATDPWREFASCKILTVQEVEEIFINVTDVTVAERFCGGCAVQLECIEDAIVWEDGGYRGIPEESREKIIRHRKRYRQYFLYDLERANVGF